MVCFICLSGHPCKLFDGEKNPDYAPSLKLGHKQEKSIVTPLSTADRNERAKKREDLKRESLRKELFRTPSKRQTDECKLSKENDLCKPMAKQGNSSDTGVQTYFMQVIFQMNLVVLAGGLLNLLVRRHSKIVT